MRKLFFIVLFAILANAVYGREFIEYSSRLQTKSVAGVNIPITQLFQGAETDDLIGYYDGPSFYWQVSSLSVFFSERWGAEFNFRIGTSSRNRLRGNNFKTRMQLKYGEDYYVQTRMGADFEEFNSDFSGIYLGIVYRFERNRFFIYPRFSIGLTNLRTDWGSVDLKKRNSNLEYSIFYTRPDERSPDPSTNFTIASSVSFGYKLSRHLWLNADVRLSHFRPNFTYQKTKTNLFTQERVVEQFHYRRNIFTLSLGLGLIFVI